MANNRFQTLSFTQVEKLDAVIGERRFIHSRNKALLPTTLEFALRNFIVVLRDRIYKYGIHIEEIRLNGGAASYILGNDTVPTFNDLDIIFKVNITGEAEFELIRLAVLECLRNYLSSDFDPARVNENNLAGAYVDKMIKIWNDRDRWSLISLGLRPNNVELKFVCQMVREYQFSVDSFQIMLDPLLTFYSISSKSISEHFFPTVVAESVYGSFAEAYSHLKNKLIATCSPENIRGGGLLRYCDLLVKGYQPVDEQNFVAKKEQYMCTRFFIDFMDVSEQARQISGYLQNHFSPTDHRKYDYLKLLEMVIERSAVCLMNQERQCALDVISRLAYYELRWREAFLQPFVPVPPQFAGYCYPQQSYIHPYGNFDPFNSNRAIPLSTTHSNSGRHHHQKLGKRYHRNQHNYPPRQVHQQQLQQAQQSQQMQRPSTIFCYPPNQPCRCQSCLGQSAELCENSSNGPVCCVPVWISPTRLYPPSPLVVIAGTPMTMSSPSSVGSSASSVASSGLGSNGLGTRATPSPLTTPSSAVPGSNASSTEYDPDDVEDDVEALNGEIINNCILSDTLSDGNVDSDEQFSSRANELVKMMVNEDVYPGGLSKSVNICATSKLHVNQHLGDKGSVESATS